METKNINVCETFPDGTPIDGWFYDTNVPSLEKMGKQYVLTSYGILDDGKLYTKEIQALIDLAAKEGGGVIVVPSGTYLTGALFFKQGCRAGRSRVTPEPYSAAMPTTVYPACFA